jgi:hypothetical protein
MFHGLGLEGSPEVPVNSKNSTTFWAAASRQHRTKGQLGDLVRDALPSYAREHFPIVTRES